MSLNKRWPNLFWGWTVPLTWVLNVTVWGVRIACECAYLLDHLKMKYCDRRQSDYFQNIPECISNVLKRGLNKYEWWYSDEQLSVKIHPSDQNVGIREKIMKYNWGVNYVLENLFIHTLHLKYTCLWHYLNAHDSWTSIRKRP